MSQDNSNGASTLTVMSDDTFSTSISISAASEGVPGSAKKSRSPSKSSRMLGTTSAVVMVRSDELMVGVVTCMVYFVNGSSVYARCVSFDDSTLTGYPGT